MTRLRILHVTPYSEHAWAYGGIPRVVSAIVRGLVARGHEVTVATTDACDASDRLASPVRGRLRPWRTIADRNRPEVRVFPNLSNWLAYRLQLFLPLGMGRDLRASAHRFDVAHLHACHNLPGVIAAGALHRAGVPWVLQPNGTAPPIERRRLAKRIFAATIGRRALYRADRVIAVSTAERSQLLKLGVRAAAIADLPNPVELVEYEALPQESLYRDRKIVLYLGQLTPRKRVDLLIRAFAALPEPGLRLVIAGGDPRSEGPLRRLAHSLGIAARTSFAGVLRGSRRLAALRDATVVAYPTEDEIFGLVPLEALLCGTAVVVADGCGCAEVIRTVGGGRVVPPGEITGLADALRSVLEHPESWREPVRHAASRVRQLYSSESVCCRLEALYREIARPAAEAGK